MKKYIYLFKFKDDEKTLFELELKEYFNCSLKDQKTIMTSVDRDVESTIFTRHKLDVEISCDTIKDLVDILEERKYSLVDYKIIWAKNEDFEYDYKQQLKDIRSVGQSILGDFNLRTPTCIYGVTYAFNQYHFGKVYTHTNSWMKHINKPYSYSYSLDVRLARTLVNIASKGDQECRIIDPCCGVATVVLEGQYLGYNISGTEINPLIAENGIKNLGYYGYKNSICNMDMFDIKDHYDIAILDIPYGVCEKVEESFQIELLKGSYKIADRLLLVTCFEFERQINSVNFKVVDVGFVKKSNFKRYIYLCEKN